VFPSPTRSTLSRTYRSSSAKELGAYLGQEQRRAEQLQVDEHGEDVRERRQEVRELDREDS
jgi:hypothetical protein